MKYLFLALIIVLIAYTTAQTCSLPNCASCGADPRICNNCYSGFFFPVLSSAASSTCVPCPTGCNVCVNSTYCTVPSFMYFLKANGVIASKTPSQTWNYTTNTSGYCGGISGCAECDNSLLLVVLFQLPSDIVLQDTMFQAQPVAQHVQ